MEEMCKGRKILRNLEDCNSSKFGRKKVLPNLGDFGKFFQIWEKYCAAVAATVKTKSPV